MTEFPSYPATLYFDPTGKRGGTGAYSWTKVGQTGDIEGPGISRESIEVMHRDLTYKRYFPGLADGGEVSFSIVWDPNGDNTHGTGGSGMLPSLKTGPCTIPGWKLDLGLCSGTGYWIFDGFVTDFTPSAPVEGHHSVEITVKVDGEPVLYLT